MRNRVWYCAIAAVVVLVGWSVSDYRAWRRLGPGGLPANPGGWLITTGLRLIGRNPFAVRPRRPAPVSPGLRDLPRREGPRPRVSRHPIPHRVLGTRTSDSLRDEVRSVFDEFATSAPETLEYRTSRWEKHNQALWTRAAPEADRAGDEIGHLHPSDASAHLVLAAADAQHVIDLGWGELHPLAGRARELPTTYTLLYPPRNRSDIGSLRAILASAVEHAGSAHHARPV